MFIPPIFFWLMLFLARHDLGLQSDSVCVVLWFALLIGSAAADISPLLFVATNSLADIVQLLVIFGGDIRIR